jgi:hypothetical protein
LLIGRTNSFLPGNNTIMNFAPALIATIDDIAEIVSAVKKRSSDSDTQKILPKPDPNTSNEKRIEEEP